MWESVRILNALTCKKLSILEEVKMCAILLRTHRIIHIAYLIMMIVYFVVDALRTLLEFNF